MEARIPPHNIEAEQSVLGSILLNGPTFLKVAKVVKSFDFYQSAHQTIFEFMTQMNDKGITIDVLTLANLLEEKGKLDHVGGSGYLASLVNGTPSYSSAAAYASIVAKHAVLRRLIQAGHEIQESGYQTGKEVEEIIESANKNLLAVSSVTRNEKTDIRSITDEFEKKQIEYAESIIAGNELLGYSTGYLALDKATDGFQPHDLITIAAFTSVGKSGFTINLVNNLLKKGKRVVIFSLEMSQQDIVARLIALELNCHSYDVLKGLAQTDGDKYNEIKMAVYEMSKKPLSIYTELQTVDEVIMAMQEECLTNQVDLFVLDYIQNISSKKYMDEYALLTDAIKRFQRTIAGLNATMIVISQISNDSQKKQDVLNVQGKGSGAIRAASDLFVYLKNEGTEEEILQKLDTGVDVPMLAIINKNRITGRVFSFPLMRDQRTGKIYETVQRPPQAS